ncbi:aspartate aminotransferase family protein [Actinosynnema sp. NPDC020468]|uniref:class-III pyridoxal-phosphate-dependent aminotransferase n=1 Tax=Actinosynnema sp. NPDC020468 TaxID=3154488 RepID=UPI00340EE801
MTAEVTNDAGRTLYDWLAQKNAPVLDVVRAEGVWFETASGRRVLDFASQLVAANLGHSLRPIAEAVLAESERASYVSPAMAHPAKDELTRRLTGGVLPPHLTRISYCATGNEAVNDAIRIARTVTGRDVVLFATPGYHGAQGTGADTSGDVRRDLMRSRFTDAVPFLGPYRPGVSTPDSAEVALERFVTAAQAVGPERVAAVLVEAVPGSNGVLVPPAGYLAAVGEFCARHGILLVCDEVMTGFGRTGRWFAFEHEGVRPDLVTLGKALTAGFVPLGAVATTAEVAAHFESSPFVSGHTFGGTPIQCAAALAALDAYEAGDVIAAADRAGGRLADWLASASAGADWTGRSRGLFAAVDLADGARAGEVARALLASDVYCLQRGTFLMLAPPLVVSDEELDLGLARLGEALAR